MTTRSSRPPPIDPALTNVSRTSSSPPLHDGPTPFPPARDPPIKETKSRVAITELERKSLRDYAHIHPTIPHKEIAAWFQSTFAHRIAQSSISDSLGPRFAYLDTLSTDNLTGDGESKRRRDPSFPQLERKLVEWYEGCIGRDEQVTGELVKKAAAGLWRGMSEYRGREMPKWSNGWLEGWKQRNGINFKAHLADGERAAGRRGRTEVDEQIEREMEGEKRRKTTHLPHARNGTSYLAQSTSGTLPWDMLRPETSELQNGDVEAWDMLRPVAASLRRPAGDEGSSSSSSPEPESELNRPGYDPSMPAWLRSHTWDELPWVKDGSMGLPKGRVRKKKRRRARGAPREGIANKEDGEHRAGQQRRLQEPEAQAGSAEQPIAVDAPTPFDIYHGNPLY